MYETYESQNAVGLFFPDASRGTRHLAPQAWNIVCQAVVAEDNSIRGGDLPIMTPRQTILHLTAATSRRRLQHAQGTKTMTKIVPGWSNGLKVDQKVEGAPAKGHPNPAIPHFIPEQPLGKPKAGVDQRP